MGLANACINPILYGYLNESFREEYKNLFKRLPWMENTSVAQNQVAGPNNNNGEINWDFAATFCLHFYFFQVVFQMVKDPWVIVRWKQSMLEVEKKQFLLKLCQIKSLMTFIMTPMNIQLNQMTMMIRFWIFWRITNPKNPMATVFKHKIVVKAMVKKLLTFEITSTSILISLDFYGNLCDDVFICDYNQCPLVYYCAKASCILFIKKAKQYLWCM